MENPTKLASVLLLTLLSLVAAAPVAFSEDNTNVIATEPSLLANGRVATLDPVNLVDFDSQPPQIQKLITAALALTKQGLGYHYGSADPASGGMDCSGTIYYLLRQAGINDPPRDSGELYRWVWTESRFQAVVSSSPNTFELARLKPGDLLFWADTYNVQRDPPVSHVMVYLGVSRLTGSRVMMGASEGRRFDGISRFGVSVFDFVLPRPAKDAEKDQSPPRFIGYGAIPGLPNP